MTLMQFREMRSCPEHRQVIIVLGEVGGHRTLALAADPDESVRFAREIVRNSKSEHPIYDFVEGLLRTLGARPIRIVLEYVPGAGLAGSVAFSGREGEASVSCYPSDALALAKRSGVPIYVNDDVFTHVRPFAAKPSEADPLGGVAEWLERIKPEDFSSSPPGDRIAAE